MSAEVGQGKAENEREDKESLMVREIKSHQIRRVLRKCEEEPI